MFNTDLYIKVYKLNNKYGNLSLFDLEYYNIGWMWLYSILSERQCGIQMQYRSKMEDKKSSIYNIITLVLNTFNVQSLSIVK